jgi:serine/threonine protein kinase
MSIGDLNEEDLDGLVGRELDGRYLLDKFIDRGGFGAVYRAIDKKFNRHIAVKVGLSYREFMKEAKLAAEVRHDHIVQVSDYGHDHGLAYLVMEFLHGEDLEKLFKRQGCTLTADQLRKFISEVGDALAHAHAENLIHRDLKPRNIILKQSTSKTSASALGKFVLLDFGIAAKMDAEGTQRNRTQDGAGTLEYMAPELLKINPTTTPQSDIYAFGVLVYQMLTGQVPYPQTDTSHIALAEIVYAITNLPPPPFSTVAPDRTYPPTVESLVMECLEKDPARRPASMSEVRDRFLEALTPVAPRPSDYSQTLLPGDLSGTVFAGKDDAISSPVKPYRTEQSRAPLFLALALIIAVGLALGWQFTRQEMRPFPTLTMVRGTEIVAIDEGASLELLAGNRVTLTFAIDDLAHGVSPHFELPSVPAYVDVEMNSGPVVGISKNFVVSVPDLNAPPGQLPPFTIKATIPNSKSVFERTVSLKILRPTPWLPEPLRSLGFEEAADSQLCRIGTELYSSLLERRIGGKPVRFRLIPSVEIGDRRIRTFYATEQLITNALFNEFAKAEPGFEFQARTQAERVWETGDDFPVTQVYVLEAQRFAQWLAGRTGSLPTTMEWELLAGYYDFLRVLESKFRQSPFEASTAELQDFRAKEVIPGLNAEVWIGPGPALNEFRDTQGTSLKDCSPYGCQFARLPNGARPTEMTATIFDFTLAETELREVCRHGVPDSNDANLRENQYSARLRGFGDRADTNEILWVKSERNGLRVRRVEDLNNDAGVVTLLPNGIERDSYIGFRVVLQIEADKK